MDEPKEIHYEVTEDHLEVPTMEWIEGLFMSDFGGYDDENHASVSVDMSRALEFQHPVLLSLFGALEPIHNVPAQNEASPSTKGKMRQVVVEMLISRVVLTELPLG